MDDVRNEYGGWHDPELSEKGLLGAKTVGNKLIKEGIKVEKILSSPLKRTRQTADVIATVFGLPVEENVYLKERNSYGLLCGLNKTEAKEKYPELVGAYENKQPVLGYEDYDFFMTRIKMLIEKLGKYQANIIAVTHGKVLSVILSEFLGKKPSNLDDNCIIEAEINDDKLTLKNTVGVEF